MMDFFFFFGMESDADLPRAVIPGTVVQALQVEAICG